jgi:hypothetical protein
MATKAQAKHMGLVAELPCCLCGSMPVEVHHVTEGKTFGKRDKLHFATIPLCPSCHRDNRNGIHGQQFMLKLAKKSELELLAETLEMIYGRA